MGMSWHFQGGQREQVGIYHPLALKMATEMCILQNHYNVY